MQWKICAWKIRATACVRKITEFVQLHLALDNPGNMLLFSNVLLEWIEFTTRVIWPELFY
jgi:hypothetical protein